MLFNLEHALWGWGKFEDDFRLRTHLGVILGLMAKAETADSVYADVRASLTRPRTAGPFDGVQPSRDNEATAKMVVAIAAAKPETAGQLLDLLAEPFFRNADTDNAPTYDGKTAANVIRSLIRTATTLDNYLWGKPGERFDYPLRFPSILVRLINTQLTPWARPVEPAYQSKAVRALWQLDFSHALVEPLDQAIKEWVKGPDCRTETRKPDLAVVMKAIGDHIQRGPLTPAGPAVSSDGYSRNTPTYNRSSHVGLCLVEALTRGLFNRFTAEERLAAAVKLTN